MNLWTEVRRSVLVGGMSRRDACKKYNLNFRTIQKILTHEEPPGYRREHSRERPKLGPFLSIIHEILEADKKAHKKQRHTGRRIFERLRDECAAGRARSQRFWKKTDRRCGRFLPGRLKRGV